MCLGREDKHMAIYFLSQKQKRHNRMDCIYRDSGCNVRCVVLWERADTQDFCSFLSPLFLNFSQVEKLLIWIVIYKDSDCVMFTGKPWSVYITRFHAWVPYMDSSYFAPASEVVSGLLRWALLLPFSTEWLPHDKICSPGFSFFFFYIHFNRVHISSLCFM